STGWAVGTNATALYTANGGTTWENRVTGLPVAAHVRAVYFADATHGWIGADSCAQCGSSRIYYTADAGLHWTSRTPATGCNPYIGLWGVGSLYFRTLTEGWAVTGYGGIYPIRRTVDGGANWTTEDPASFYSLRAVSMTGSNTAVAVGIEGAILQRPGTGPPWAQVTSGTLNDLNGVSFPTASVGYAVGN